jgi:hypothetical protein
MIPDSRDHVQEASKPYITLTGVDAKSFGPILRWVDSPSTFGRYIFSNLYGSIYWLFYWSNRRLRPLLPAQKKSETTHLKVRNYTVTLRTPIDKVAGKVMESSWPWEGNPDVLC